MRKSRKYYDSETDSLLIVFKNGEEDRYEEIAPGINVEFNEADEIIGIEILNASRLYNIKSGSSTSGDILKKTYGVGMAKLTSFTFRIAQI